MERIYVFFRAQPVLLGLLLFVLIAAGLLIFFSVAMARAGLSLRPLLFLAVFFGIIAGPQVVFHSLRATGKVGDLTWTPSVTRVEEVTENPESVQGISDGFLYPEIVLGAGYDPDLLSDVRRLFDPLQDQVETAQMAIFRNQETTMAVRARTPDAALQAARYFAAILGHPELPVRANESRDVPRAAGDWARLRVVGRMLFVWTGADVSALDRRQQASAGAWIQTRVEASPPAVKKRADAWVIAAVPVLLVVAVGWFFKGSSWAATVAPKTLLHRPVPLSELRSRLLALDLPSRAIAVVPGERNDEIIVTWKVSEAWLTPMRASGLRRTHRLVLRMDETARTVRVREDSAALDVDFGKTSAALSWRRERGISFFQVQHQYELGVPMGTKAQTAPSSAGISFRFNLQELKGPVIATVIGAGWTWKPVLWESPQWLRWATE
ncbi:MAG TPA: hypothetical protein PLN52_07970 [Opitutaceae bacterium]|nr:hypothetical protein [Opitutaceae bacterium]